MSSKKIYCKKLKKKSSCIKYPNECIWETDNIGKSTCEYKIESPKYKKVICAKRKEKSCKSVPKVCKWSSENKKCLSAFLDKIINIESNNNNQLFKEKRKNTIMCFFIFLARI